MLVGRHPQLLFLVVGDGPERLRLVHRAQQMGIHRSVRFLGARRDIPEILRASDVCVLTSDYEGVPNTVLEAMAVGVPVVTTAFPGADRVVTHGREGFLVPLQQPEAMARRLACLLDDSELRRKMGRCGEERVRRDYSLEAMGSAMLDVYRGCLAPERTRRAR